MKRKFRILMWIIVAIIAAIIIVVVLEKFGLLEAVFTTLLTALIGAGYEYRKKIGKFFKHQFEPDPPSLINSELPKNSGESHVDHSESITESAEKTETSSFELELPEGQVPLNSAFYVTRPPIEEDCFEAILKPYALVRVKAPRQMGKTSLMSRMLDHAKKSGHRTVSFSFQEADGIIFQKLDDVLRWFCASVANRLNLEDELEKRWKGVVGSKSKCSNYFKDYLLPNANAPLTLGLDEVDQVFQYLEVAQDFFGLLRAWHEESKKDETWKKLRLILVHSQEVYVPLNINQSPFNVGLPIELPELTEVQAIDLAQRHRLEWSETEVAQLMALVGGHPYLLRVAFYAIARKRITLEKLIDTAATHGGLYFEHLHRHDVNLQEAKLDKIMREIAMADKPVEGIDSTKVFKLRSMGLIKFEKNAVVPFCGLYRQYFKQRTNF